MAEVSDTDAGRRAALYFVPSGYTTAGPELLGINAATEGFLRALVRYGDMERLTGVAEYAEFFSTFRDRVTGWKAEQAVDWVPLTHMDRLAEAGTLFLPGPGLGDYAWMRRRFGPSSFSLCGVAHTTATPLVLDALVNLLTAPVEAWDALVCPSRSVQTMVSELLDEQALYLQERLGGNPPPRPQTPIIPLGVETDDFAPHAAQRREWRQRLEIKETETALLFVGRLNPTAKAHPIPLLMAAAAAARQLTTRLHLVLAGWFENAAGEAIYRNAAAQICPDVALHILDGRDAGVRSAVWSASDIFISPSDNIQETFGLTPIEAMAAGLPVIVSAWDGYKESVRHGVDGFLIPTLAPPPATATAIANNYGARMTGYSEYVGAASQSVAVDIPAMSDAIVTLAKDAGLRMQMGAQGQAHAKAAYDWKGIIPQYLELWEDLVARRRADRSPASRAQPYPARPDPFTAFRNYPSRTLDLTMRFTVGKAAPDFIDYLLDSPLANFVEKTLPSRQTLKAVLALLEAAPLSARDILQLSFPTGERMTWRALGWLLKYDLARATGDSGQAQ